MKRSGPPQRRTPLPRPTKPLKRTKMADKPRRPLPRESTKRKAERPERERVRAETLTRAGNRCELAAYIPEVTCWHPAGEPFDVDEIAARGVAPGSHLDASITVATCRGHHIWRTDHPKEASERGIRITGGEYEQRRRTAP